MKAKSTAKIKIGAGVLLTAFVALMLGLGYYFTPPKTTMLALDTVISIDIKNMGPIKTKKLLKGSFDICSQYEQRLSRTIPGNLLDQMNQGETVTVSAEIAELLEKAVAFSKLSEGSFDVTVKPLAELWDVKITRTEKPLNADILNALASVNYENIEINGNEVTLKNGTQIDLGGIAKGFIGDKIKEYLIQEGCESAIVNLGGNVVAIGVKPDGGPWSVGIQKPFTDDGVMAGVLQVKDKSVVTSGSYERYFVSQGVTYHHIIDPKTGYPADNDLNAVTIVCDKSVDADALSTACFVLGLDKGMALLEEIGNVKGVFITKDGEVFQTSGLSSEVVFEPR